MVAIGAPAGRIAQRVELERDFACEAERLEDPAAERDHLDVGGRLGRPQHLDVDLMELAQPALLRALVAKHRTATEQPDG